MHIIAGERRGAQLFAPKGLDTRPTQAKVKESLFNIIQAYVPEADVLDLFSGSGNLALEALSRGAAKATVIDASREAMNVIMDNAKKTRLFDRCRISCADYASFIRGAQGWEKYDIGFLDPPYGAGLMPEALRKLDRGELYAPGAVIVCETDNGTDARPSRRNRSEEEIAAKEAEAIMQDVFGGDESLAARYEVQKSVSYGRARITLLRPAVSEV